MIVCTGTLTANVELILPGTIGGSRQIFNQTTGAFTLTVLNGASDTGGGVVVGQGYMTSVVLTAGRAYYDAYSAIPAGVPLPFAGPNLPPGFLLCFGQAVSRTTYSQLFTALGTTWGIGDGSTTFNVPFFNGRTLVGADNMGGTAANVLPGATLGTLLGAATVTLTAAQLPVTAYQDSGHIHTQNPHNHTFPYQNYLPGNSGTSLPLNGVAAGTSGNVTTNPSTPTINSGTANISNPTGGGSHSNVQPTAAVNFMIRF